MKAIETHCLWATNTKGARVVASDGDGNRTTVPWPSRETSEAAHRVAAEALRDKMGWSGQLVGGTTKRGYAFVFVS